MRDISSNIVISEV